MSLSPPRPKPLPLNALRAFEAAARLGGFRLAAEELCVTPGAVAQQIKALERTVGAALFERHAQGVRLTAVGAAVRPDFETAFDALSLAADRLRRLAAPRRVAIAALPAIAELLLRPWLPRLRDAVPGVEISVTALEQPPNLLREPFDISLFLETDTSGVEVLAGPDRLLPVCSPALMGRVADLTDLLALPHISDQAWAGDWPLWWGRVAHGAPYTGEGPSFSLYALAVSEAEAGAGVLIGHELLLGEQLLRGDLVPAAEDRVTTDHFLCARRAGAATRSPEIETVLAALRRLATTGRAA